MFSDEPLNLNQARTKNKYEEKLIFLYVHNDGRLIFELDANDVSTTIDQFINFLLAAGYSESLIWDTLSNRVGSKDSFEILRKQFRSLDEATDVK